MLKEAPAEFGEEVVFRELPFRKKAKRIIITLAVLIVLLVILCLVFIVLFAVEKRKTHEQAAENTGQVTQQPNICDSRKCLFASVGKFATKLFSFYLLISILILSQLPLVPQTSALQA